VASRARLAQERNRAPLLPTPLTKPFPARHLSLKGRPPNRIRPTGLHRQARRLPASNPFRCRTTLLAMERRPPIPMALSRIPTDMAHTGRLPSRGTAYVQPGAISPPGIGGAAGISALMPWLLPVSVIVGGVIVSIVLSMLGHPVLGLVVALLALAGGIATLVRVLKDRGAPQ